MGNGVNPAGGTSGVSSYGAAGQEDVITVQKGETSLAQVAKRVGIPESDLRDANPQIKDPKHIKQGQEVHYPQDLLVAPGETKLSQVASRLGIPEEVLRKGNPQIKDPNNLHAGQAIQLPKDFFEEPAGAKKTGSKTEEDDPNLSVSEEGVNAKLPKGSGKVKPDGSVVYSPPKIGPVQPQIIVKGLPGIPSKDDSIPDPNAAIRKQDDWQTNLDTKTKEKLDNQQKRPGQKITDRQIQKGFDEANNQSLEKDLEAKLAAERLKHPKQSLKMRQD